MAKNETPVADQPKKDRRPARTIDERIAELKAVAEARQAKDAAKATAKLTVLNDKIVKLESQLGDLYVARTAARAVLGITEDAAPAEAPAEVESV
jgi:outer membrane protein assembly factor BamD (BamD/ComL family)